MFVFTLLLYGELNQMMFLFCCFLLLAVFIFRWYFSLYLYPDLSKASWYGVAEPLTISSEELLDEDGGWLDSVFMYFT